MSDKLWAGLIGGWIAIVAVIQAATLHVPGQYPTIQEGINAAVDGDTVLVADGTYTGNGNKNIDFLGKAIVVTSESGAENCIIDCEDDGRGFYFHSGEDSSSVLCGFKITNGRAEEGGGIAIWYSSPLIRYCIIQDNVAWYEDGGGIFCIGASPLIENCEILDNTVLGWLRGYGHGGGISCRWDSHPNITDCIISGNSVYSSWVTNGGGIYSIYGSSVTISRSIISGNSANNGIGGGFWCFDDCSFSISNCTIYGNSAVEGGGIALGWNCNLLLLNSIVAGNEINGIEFSISYNVVSLTYCDFYDNVGVNFAGSSIPPGLGQIVTVNANGDSCDIFYNIFEDPLFEDPASGSFQITWANYPIPDSTRSPCIDAGDPNSPLDPDGTIADMGALYFHQGMPVAITLSPYNPPIVIPPGGDAFAYNIEIANNGNTPETFDVWVNIEVPGGYQFTVLGPVYGLTLAAASSVERDRTVFVPGSAPAGDYSCLGMIGTYPWTVIASDAFTFSKEGADGIWTGSDGWILTGEPFPGEETIQEVRQPETFTLLQPFPNPFNPLTTVRFALPQASHVKLTIYNLQGRKVADLVDGLREAGIHEVTWDASKMTSGLYFCRIQAGDWSEVQKMVLMK